jgi:hypothetical protein
MIYYFKDLILLLIINYNYYIIIFSLKNETRTNIQEQKENKKNKLNYLL